MDEAGQPRGEWINGSLVLLGGDWTRMGWVGCWTADRGVG